MIGNPTYRNEMMYKVAESMASGSASIANEYVQASAMPDNNPAQDAAARACGSLPPSRRAPARCGRAVRAPVLAAKSPAKPKPADN